MSLNKKTEKNKILALAFLALLALFISGCTAGRNSNSESVENEVNLQAAAEEKTETANEEQEIEEQEIVDLIEKAEYHLKRIDVLTDLILETDANTESKPMINNILSKVDEFNSEVQKMESVLDKLDKYDFEGKDEFLRIFREIARLSKGIVAKVAEFYRYNLKTLEQETLSQKNNKIEELATAVYSCGCKSADCNAYYETTMDFMDDSIEIFAEIQETYNLESYEQIVNTWAEEKKVYEEHFPDLIEKSERYADKCWRINDYYNELVADLEAIEVASENEVNDEITSKWIVPVENLAGELGNLGVEMENFLESMGE